MTTQDQVSASLARNLKIGTMKKHMGDTLYHYLKQLEDEPSYMYNETMNAVARMRESLLWLDEDVKRNHARVDTSDRSSST